MAHVFMISPETERKIYGHFSGCESEMKALQLKGAKLGLQQKWDSHSFVEVSCTLGLGGLAEIIVKEGASSPLSSRHFCLGGFGSRRFSRKIRFGRFGWNNDVSVHFVVER